MPQNAIKYFIFLCFIVFHVLPTGTATCSADEVPAAPAARKIITIDPGHGGQDVGALGVDHTREKDLTLALSKILETKLSKKYKVILTRKDDVRVELRSRTETANKSQTDLLISVHTGGGFIHETRGIGIFYYQPRADADAARGGNQSLSDYSSSRNKNAIPWNTVQNRYASLSQSLARTLNEHLSSDTALTNIQESGLPQMVLTGADMPAVLIEFGQLTNPSEEKQLKDKEYLARIADGICKGIDAYFGHYPDKIVHEF